MAKASLVDDIAGSTRAARSRLEGGSLDLVFRVGQRHRCAVEVVSLPCPGVQRNDAPYLWTA
jgi:hypothetical protein